MRPRCQVVNDERSCELCWSAAKLDNVSWRGDSEWSVRSRRTHLRLSFDGGGSPNPCASMLQLCALRLARGVTHLSVPFPILHTMNRLPLWNKISSPGGAVMGKRGFTQEPCALRPGAESATYSGSVLRLAEQARSDGWGQEDCFVAVLLREVAARGSSGTQSRIRSAVSPRRKSLE